MIGNLFMFSSRAAVEKRETAWSRLASERETAPFSGIDWPVKGRLKVSIAKRDF